MPFLNIQANEVRSDLLDASKQVLALEKDNHDDIQFLPKTKKFFVHKSAKLAKELELNAEAKKKVLGLQDAYISNKDAIKRATSEIETLKEKKRGMDEAEEEKEAKKARYEKELKGIVNKCIEDAIAAKARFIDSL